MPKSGQVRNMSEPEIILYQPPRGPQAPNLSPFAVKMETFLRMAKINYTACYDRKSSPKGKSPWIKYNGKAIGDTAFMIEFLSENMGVDLNKNLNPEQKAMAHALQRMVDENLYWTSVVMRWQYHHKKWLNKVAGLPKIAVWIVGRTLKKQAHAQGIGRHSYQEVSNIMAKDLAALSAALGSKKFIMGDEPCEADASIFGQLTQIAYQGPDTPGMKMCKETYPNLWSYCERMRQTLWPDWDDCITHDGTKKTTK